MTREEIENIPKNVNTLLDLSVTMHTRQKLYEKLNEACELAIKLLEQEPCEGDEAKKIDEWEIQGKNAELWIVKGKLQIRYSGTIHNTPLPSVTPQPKTGHWINAKVGKFFPSNDFRCSECGNILDFDGVNCGRGDANYCPNCGAKMESEVEE